MSDGVKLAASIYMPVARSKGEKFPVLFEYLPYRKDDSFYIGDYPSYSYFAKHGYITVKVDIRGTGASFGDVPPREYSDIELDDGEQIIAQLAALPRSNGNVCMWGVSWSGFNSIQMAMRRPPALKTIIPIHASDDLYHDDLHYIDGVMHVDPYHLFINHELGMPSSTDYKLDARYFNSRFDSTPWLFTYLNQQLDGKFWRGKSLRENYQAINIPVFLIGGLLDGYRTATVRMMENLIVPVKIEIGPWNHSCPDEGSPAPNHEWQDEAIKWCDHWLKGIDNGVDGQTAEDKELAVFVRSGQIPDPNMTETEGKWRLHKWPVIGASKRNFYLQAGKILSRSQGKPAFEQLAYNSGSGVAAGIWWGDVTGDMSVDDAGSLVYDSGPLVKPLQIIGSAGVRLKVRSTSPQVSWSVRLEDVSPDGKVALVTGSLINSSQRADRLAPSHVVPGRPYNLALELQFTTWTFQPGHRIRLAISNSQFPMAWPNADRLTATLYTGCADTVLTLPVVPTNSGKPLNLPKPARKPECPDAKVLESEAGKSDGSKHWTYNPADGSTTYVVESHGPYMVKRRRFVVDGTSTWKTFENEPWKSSYLGKMSTSIESSRRTIKLHTAVSVQSDKLHFHVKVVRDLFENGRRVRRKVWQQTIERRFQ